MEKENKNREVPKVSAARKINITDSLSLRLEKAIEANEFRKAHPAESDVLELDSFIGPSDETIVATLIESGCTEEEANEAVENTLRLRCK